MNLPNRAICSLKGTNLLLKKNYCHVLNLPRGDLISTKKLDAEIFIVKPVFNEPFIRLLHITKVNRDVEAGLRAVGAGVAAAGVIGPGIGIGIIFGSLASACARNPSLTQKLLANSILGAAFCESLGLFAIVMGFLVTP